ncbi:MAG TPA: (p)ppGpp synthetase [Ruminococcus sp.]|nr:(p)ppGpp synthetase [Ruminococcus sp.]
MKEDRVVTIEMIEQKILDMDKQSYDLSKIHSAYEFAAKAHEGQKRSSGQPYIIHPLSVAEILLDLGMDTDTICAALLHDVVEDTDATLEQLEKLFGQDVAALVDGVTKLAKIPIFNKEQQLAENVMKILLAMSKDIRVMIIKLCDRLHNMRTLEFRPEHKQRTTARETMNVYAPIARRLGIKVVQAELEDLAFHYLDPYAYQDIENLMGASKEEREIFLNSIIQKVSDYLPTAMEFKKPPQISGRVKSIYGMYKKIYVQHKNPEEVYDKYAIRIIVSDLAECYAASGLIQNIYPPIPNRRKDYISHPKENMYQSLHDCYLGKEGIPFEVQIRTWEMHETAEYGIAAHWKYKEGIHGKDKMEKRLAWIRQMIEAQKTSDDVEEIVRAIKYELAPEDICVMTPKGQTISLPIGATVVDFAYKIHTEVGHKMMSAKVNGKIVPLDYKLQTGDICTILTSKDPTKGPSRSWLDIAITSEARSKIRSWFKRERREENIQTGKSALEKLFRHNHIHVPDEELENFLKDDLRRHSCNTLEDFYAAIGYGGISLSKLLPHFKEQYHKNYEKDDEEPKDLPIVTPVPNSSRSKIILDDISDCAVKFAQCCNPLPGDEIVGFITRGHGISVHTTSCVNYRAMLNRDIPEEQERWVDIQWTESTDSSMQTSIEVIAQDRVGLVYDITAVLTESRIPIVHSSSRVLKNGNAIFDASIRIVNRSQLNSMFERLRKIKGVITVERANS